MQVLFTLLSAVTFIAYGTLCLTTNHMKKEFQRYGLAKYRRLTGVLELLGGLGLLMGLKIKLILIISSAGLGLLMSLGAFTRFRVKDPFIEIIPAIILLILNFSIFFMAVGIYF